VVSSTSRRNCPVEIGLGGGAFGLLGVVVESPWRDVTELVPASGHQLFDGLGVSVRFDYVDTCRESTTARTSSPGTVGY